MRAFLIAASLAAGLDQLVKYFIKAHLKLYEIVWVVKDFFKITYIENSGVAFGMFGGIPHPAVRWILVGIISLASIGITVYWIKNRKQSLLYDLACGLILGGAIGNLIDRIRIGRITDFLEFGYKNITFPVFNVADSAVTVGVSFFIIFVLNEGKRDNNASGPV
jgi:signal peptidase II